MPNNSLLSINDSVNHCQVVDINNHQISVINYRNQPVLTFKQIDELHNRAEGTARRIFNDNKNRFIEGKHFVKLGVNEIRTSLPQDIFSNHTSVILVFQVGYLFLAKSLTDDLAWQVQDALVECYFKAKTAPISQPKELSRKEILTIALELEQENETQKVIIQAQKDVISDLKEVAKLGERLSQSKGTHSMREACKLLSDRKNKIITETHLKSFCRVRGMTLIGSEPSAQMIQSQHFEYVRKTYWNASKEENVPYHQTRVTDKGLKLLSKHIDEYPLFWDLPTEAVKNVSEKLVNERLEFLETCRVIEEVQS